jgi:hypothetical protein
MWKCGRVVEGTCLENKHGESHRGFESYHFRCSLSEVNMDEQTLENWKKIKESMESSGNTNNMFYTRACAILRTGKDPMENILDKKFL